jgi:hypothetical protein
MVTGNPGCVKTTQMPQFILEQYGKGQIPCRVLSVFQRRISSQATAERVRYERGKFCHLTEFSIRRNYFVTLFRTQLDFMLLLCRCDGGKTHRVSNKPKKPGQCFVANCPRNVSPHHSGRKYFSGLTHPIIDEVHCRDRYTGL